jgi:hypothetical protein
MAKKGRKSARGRKQDRARVAGGQDYEVRSCFPLMTLMAALPELLKFASGRCRHKHSGRNVSYGI